jgi:holdfast attachment protein HfaA
MILAFLGAGMAFAQSGSTSASAYLRGSSGGYGTMSSPVVASVRDANGNLTILDGVIQSGNDNSVFGKLSTSGALDQFSGAGGVSTSGSGSGAGTATAIGNNLVVVTTGNYNTVIVNANQSNTGTVTATTTVLNGKVNLNE